MNKNYKLHSTSIIEVRRSTKCDFTGCDADATGEAAAPGGMTILVCDEHGEELANKTEERKADRWYDDSRD